jgi:hypothetical protein
MNRPSSCGKNYSTAQKRSFLERFLRKNLLGLSVLTAGFAITLSAVRAEATNYYVSPLGNNTTGTSYGTAFTELNRIKWSLLKPFDVIYIDGGQSQTTYKTTLTIPASSSQVIISHALDAGHTGTVIIDGTSNSSGIGINVLSNNTSVYGTVNNNQGLHFQGMVLQNFTNCGVRIDQPATSFLAIQGISFISDATGIHAVNCQPVYQNGQAQNNTVQNCNFQNCTSAGVTVESAASLPMTLCWFYNSTAPSSSKTQAGIISVAQTQSSQIGGAGATKCVFGPQLNYGIVVQKNGNPCYVSNCLFLDAYKSNFSFGLPPFAENRYLIPSLSNVTAVSTAKNPNNVGHNTIVASAANVQSSIFLGAQVNAPAGAQFFSGQSPNEQYDVTGNTTALAPTQINPQFYNPAIYTFPYNVSPETLIGTDYSTQNSSFGSSLTSVAALQSLQQHQ